MAILKGITQIPDFSGGGGGAQGAFNIHETAVTIDDTPLPIPILSLANNITYTFELNVVGRLEDTGTDKGVGGKLEFVVYRNDNSNAIIADDTGGVVKQLETYGLSDYDFDITVSGNDVRVSVTGGSSEVVTWTINGSYIITPDAGNLAFGGTVTEIEDSGNNYRVHTFTDTGSDSFVVIDSSLDVEYLIVAGGGGGGSGCGGGGGAGGLLTNLGGSPLTLNSGIYNITVGAGGSGGSPSGTPAAGSNGQNSVLDSLTAIGGGGGGYIGGVGQNGASGGSGGGGGATGGSGTVGQGESGGNGNISTSPFPAGGGGGATSVGGNFSGSVGGAGGDGLASSISGILTTYAGGGGGGVYEAGTAGGSGGAGGGGNGSHTGSGSPGTSNTGGGGGGATRLSGIGGNGGSGIVIIRYQI